MPGLDIVETTKLVLGECEDLPFLPELPARGPHAQMIGRTLGLITALGADLQPDGWRIGVGAGIDQRRARSLLAQDLDLVEEIAHDHDGPFKVQVAGPLTLAASVEHPRGDKMLADHGARRELTEAWVVGLGEHLADLSRRFAHADLIVQVDEPAIRSVLDGQVPTASGYRTHRGLDDPEVDAHLRPAVEVIRDAGAVPVVHACAADLPVALLGGAGFAAISFDLDRARPLDAWAEAFDAGVDLWVGAIASTDALRPPSSGSSADRVAAFFSALGYELESFADRLVVTPACGLAGASTAWSRAALGLCAETAHRLGS